MRLNLARRAGRYASPTYVVDLLTNLSIKYLAQGSQAQRRDAIAARARPSVPDQTSPMSDLLSGSANGAAVAT